MKKDSVSSSIHKPACMQHVFLRRQLAKLYALEFLGACNLTDSIWLLLLVSRGFTLWEAGIAEGVFHLVSFLCEIPSGMAADLYGRKRTLAASWLAAAFSAVLMLASHSLAGICLSFALGALGYNLASGTREALTYDSLLEAGEAQRYLRTASNQNAIWSGTGAVSRLLAGVALALGYRLCYLLRLVTSLCGGALACLLREPTTAPAACPGGAVPPKKLRRIAQAFMAQTRAAAGFLRSTPNALACMLSAAGTGGLVTLTFFFLQQHFVQTGGGGALLGPLLFVVCMGSMCGAKLALPLQRLRHRNAVAVCAGGAAFGIALCGAPSVAISAAGGFTMLVCEEALNTLTDARLNHMFPSALRATLVSVFTMCFSLVMVPASPLLGLLCETVGTQRAFWLCAGVLAVCTLAGRVWAQRKAQP